MADARRHTAGVPNLEREAALSLQRAAADLSPRVRATPVDHHRTLRFPALHKFDHV